MDKYTLHKKQTKYKEIIIGTLFSIIGGGIFYLIMFSPIEYEKRKDQLHDLNQNIEAEIIEVNKILGNSQRIDGARVIFSGFSIKYKYFYKGVLFKKEDFIANNKEFESLIKRCKQLKKYDVLQIKIDTLNPGKSLIRFLSDDNHTPHN